MRPIQIFKILSTSFLVVAPVSFALFSCAKKNNETDPKQQILKSIKIASKVENILLNLSDDEYISQPIDVKCFDQDDKEFLYPTKTQLIKEKITWITLDKNNCIHIAKNKEIGEYKIQLKAFDLQQKIESNLLVINLTVKKSLEPIIPDKIEILIDDENPFVFVTFSNKINLILKVTKEGYDPSQLIKDCYWTISDIHGPQTFDLDYNELFSIKSIEKNQTYLDISNRTSIDYIGKYTITITASLIADPNIKFSKTLSLNFVDGLTYIESDKSASFSRIDINKNWELYGGTPTINPISFEKKKIYGKRIDTISDYYSSRYDKTVISNYNLGSSITKVGNHALENEKGILNLTADYVEIFGDYALSDSSFFKLKSVNPLRWIEIGKYAFKNCYGLTEAKIPDIEIIKDYAFYNSGLKEIELGANLKEIGIGAFHKCIDLKLVKIESFTPPILFGDIFSQCPASLQILVPDASLSDYLNNEQWRIYKNNIKGY